jgi:hypothetical protein
MSNPNLSKTLSLGERSRQLVRKPLRHKEEIMHLLAQKTQLDAKIRIIEKRLSCGSSSEPLSHYLHQLTVQDMQLACQLTTWLTQDSEILES